MASSIPTFKAGLKTRLAAAIADTQVSRGNPHPDRLRRRLVVVGKAAPDPGQEPITYPLGSGQRLEVYTVEVIVSVIDTVRTPHETLEDEAYDIAADIETSLLAWASESPIFGGLCDWCLVQSMSDSEGIATNEAGQAVEREAAVSVLIGVTAHV